MNAPTAGNTNPVDFLAGVATLVDIASESHNEQAITEHIEARLRAVSWLEVTRVDLNLVARTTFGHPMRLILAGHTDTVPANNNAAARIDGDVLHGLGSADMKSGLWVFLHLAETLQPSDYGVDVTYVFYECEEVAAVHNGLKKLLSQRPELVAGDAAVLGEPTTAVIEAGCQGTMRAVLTLRGARAHSARPWMGRNAIHRAATVLARIDAFPGREPLIDGCTYRESVQVVKIEGGVAGNVVPDAVHISVNHRFAPDRDVTQATAFLRSLIGEDVLADDASFEVVDFSNGAAPALTHPLLARVADQVDVEPRAKLGWTDVAFFAAQSIPAMNFGPGDPTIAHTQGEHVYRHEVEAAVRVLRNAIRGS